MSNVIRGPWDGKGPDNKKSEGRLPSEEQLRQQLSAMLAYLTNLQNEQGGPAVTEENIEKRMGGLEGHSIQDLRQMIWKSDFRDWKAHPSYYFAAARTLHAKIKTLLEESDPNRD